MHITFTYALFINNCLPVLGLQWDANPMPAVICQDNQRSPDQNNKLGVPSCPGRSGGFGKAGTPSSQEGLLN